MENEVLDQSASDIEIIDVSKKNKRKLSMEESEDASLNPAKRVTVEHIIPTYYDISNEIQLLILKNLDTDSIINFSQTCSRFHLLCEDKKYWNTIDCTTNNLTNSEVMTRLNRVDESTITFKVKGNSAKGTEAANSRELKDRHTMAELVGALKQRSPFLETLYLEQLWFDYAHNRAFRIKEFPSQLKSITFNRLIYPNPRAYKRESKIFTSIDTYMPNLTELRLDFCNFFETNDLTAFSKIPNLKILSLQGCNNMKNCVPYLSLSCRFGFTKLEVFDLRSTHITDSELQCLNILPNLKELLIQRPIDKVKRPKNRQNDPKSSSILSFTNGNRPASNGTFGVGCSSVSDSATVSQQADALASQEAAAQAAKDAISIASRKAVADAVKASGASKPSLETVANALKLAVAGTSQEDVAGSTDRNENGVVYDSDTEDSEDAFFVSGMHHNPRFDSDSDEGPAPQVEERYIRVDCNNDGFLAVERVVGQPVIPVAEPPAGNAEGGEAIQFPPLGAVVRLFVGSPEFGNRFLRLNEMALPAGFNEYPTGISDRGFLGFGVPRPELIRDLVFLRAQRRDPQTYLERLTIRKYPRVTNTTLSHLSTNAPNLVYIDITGCEQITDEGIEEFKMMKPNCRVVAEDRNMF